MSARPKNPVRPPGPLSIDPQDISVVDGAELFRITFASSPFALAWGRLRSWGPVAKCRWDPHPQPPGDHPGEGVLYTAGDLMTCVAEVFADTRIIDTRCDTPVLQIWQATRAMRLLNLSGQWALRNGASAALDSAPRSTCRAWARAVREQAPDLDGLAVRSTMTGRGMTVLFAPAASSIPPRPRDSVPLTDSTIYALLVSLAPRIGYTVV